MVRLESSGVAIKEAVRFIMSCAEAQAANAARERSVYCIMVEILGMDDGNIV